MNNFHVSAVTLTFSRWSSARSLLQLNNLAGLLTKFLHDNMLLPKNKRYSRACKGIIQLSIRFLLMQDFMTFVQVFSLDPQLDDRRKDIEKYSQLKYTIDYVVYKKHQLCPKVKRINKFFQAARESINNATYPEVHGLYGMEMVSPTNNRSSMVLDLFLLYYSAYVLTNLTREENKDGGRSILRRYLHDSGGKNIRDRCAFSDSKESLILHALDDWNDFAFNSTIMSMTQMGLVMFQTNYSSLPAELQERISYNLAENFIELDLNFYKHHNNTHLTHEPTQDTASTQPIQQQDTASTQPIQQQDTASTQPIQQQDTASTQPLQQQDTASTQPIQQQNEEQYTPAQQQIGVALSQPPQQDNADQTQHTQQQVLLLPNQSIDTTNENNNNAIFDADSNSHNVREQAADDDLSIDLRMEEKDDDSFSDMVEENDAATTQPIQQQNAVSVTNEPFAGLDKLEELPPADVTDFIQQQPPPPVPPLTSGRHLQQSHSKVSSASASTLPTQNPPRILQEEHLKTPPEYIIQQQKLTTQATNNNNIPNIVEIDQGNHRQNHHHTNPSCYILNTYNLVDEYRDALKNMMKKDANINEQIRANLLGKRLCYHLNWFFDIFGKSNVCLCNL